MIELYIFFDTLCLNIDLKRILQIISFGYFSKIRNRKDVSFKANMHFKVLLVLNLINYLDVVI